MQSGQTEVVEVFSEKPVMSVLGGIKLGGGVLLLGLIVFAMMRGTGAVGVNVLGIAAAALLLIGFGIFDLTKVMDRRVQIRLTPEGFQVLDLGEFSVPWSMVESIEYLPTPRSPAIDAVSSDERGGVADWVQRFGLGWRVSNNQGWGAVCAG